MKVKKKKEKKTNRATLCILGNFDNQGKLPIAEWPFSLSRSENNRTVTQAMRLLQKKHRSPRGHKSHPDCKEFAVHLGTTACYVFIMLWSRNAFESVWSSVELVSAWTLLLFFFQWEKNGHISLEYHGELLLGYKYVQNSSVDSEGKVIIKQHRKKFPEKNTLF